MQGYLLKKQELSDQDLLIIIFSKEEGKKGIVAKNFLKKNMANSIGGLDYFNLNKYNVFSGKNLSILKEFEVLHYYENFRKNYLAYQEAARITAIISKIVFDEQADEKLFIVYQNCLNLLDRGQKKGSVREYFFSEIIHLLGIKPAGMTTINEQQFEFLLSDYLGAKIVYQS